jgi:RND family efflux transporter MFP subunit
VSIGHWWQRTPLAAKLLLVGVIAVTALVLLKPRPEPRPSVEVPLPQVRVITAQPHTTSLDVTTQGTIMPRRQINLVSQVSGRITRVAPHFVNGGFFAAEESLVQIDERDYQYALIQAEANTVEAQRAVAIERGQARQAEREWRDLGNTDANDLFLRKPQLAAAEAQLAAAQAQRDQAKLNLERTNIRAPFAGRISETFVDLGQFVTSGTPIAAVYDASVAEVRLPLTDLQAWLIELPINNATTTLPAVTLTGVIAGQSYQWPGVMTRTEASLDPQSRMHYAVVEINEPFNTSIHPTPLLMGMHVDARISGKSIDNVIRLPKTVLFRRNQVYTLDVDQRVQQKTVRVLRTDEDFVWLQAEISNGEQVVLDRQGYLKPGIKVALEESATPVSTEGASL